LGTLKQYGFGGEHGLDEGGPTRQAYELDGTSSPAGCQQHQLGSFQACRADTVFLARDLKARGRGMTRFSDLRASGRRTLQQAPRKY
jgi:hypothetical protein